MINNASINFVTSLREYKYKKKRAQLNNVNSYKQNCCNVLQNANIDKIYEKSMLMKKEK